MNLRGILLLSLLILSFSTAAEERQTSLWKKLTSEPPLPAELQTDADTFPVANVSTSRNPLSFAPFRVTKVKNGWVRGSESGPTAAVENGEIRARLAEAKQKFSFTLAEGKTEQWLVQCGWFTVRETLEYEGRKTTSTADLGGEGSLQCSFAPPHEATNATLELETAVKTQGAGFTADVSASLRSATRYYSIAPLLAVEGSRAIGDVPAGWVFMSGKNAVAALQSRGPSAPVRFTAARSLDAEQRSLLAAATAALVMFERMSAPDPIAD